MEKLQETGPFRSLLGQTRAKDLLTRSLKSNRISHGYLFRGPDGVGKKLFAMEMAKALNCRETGPLNSCGHCISCKKYASGNHPDFLVESPENGTIKIDKVRKLNKKLGFAPYESNLRVVVIEDIHTMRVEAANSLLKTLEEPPEDNVIILTAETSKSILSTIKSRCQVIPFFPLKIEETVQILTGSHDLEEEEGYMLARLSEGSPGGALLLHQTEMVSVMQEITDFLISHIKKQDTSVHKLLLLAQKMTDLKEHLPSLLGLIRIWLRDNLDETGKDGGKVYGDAEKIFRSMGAIEQAMLQLARNCNRSLVCEILLFRLQ